MNAGTRIRAAIEKLTEKTRRGELQWHRRNPRKDIWWQAPFTDLYCTVWPHKTSGKEWTYVDKTSDKKWALYVGPTRHAGIAPHTEFWAALITDAGEVERRLACGGSELVALLVEAKKNADQRFSEFLKALLEC